jgi:tRNA(fMet)-specific endonuclease VapC
LKRSKRDLNTIALREFLQSLIVLEFSEKDSEFYGKIRVDLERKGVPIGAMDLLIASQFVCRD